jgi:hypothetical protein
MLGGKRVSSARRCSSSLVSVLVAVVTLVSIERSSSIDGVLVGVMMRFGGLGSALLAALAVEEDRLWERREGQFGSH